MAGLPGERTPNGVKDHVHALAREAVNFLHKVLVLTINRDAAQLGLVIPFHSYDHFSSGVFFYKIPDSLNSLT